MLIWRDLPPSTGGGLFVKSAHGEAIVLDRRLGRRGRHATLAHELVHHERGHLTTMQGMPDLWRPVVAREELVVDREVARRLVPLDELAAYCDRMADLGEDVAPWTVAEEFDVTDEVARTALELLTRHERQR